MRRIAWWSLVAVLVGSGPSFADQVYRWTDDSGRVHYSNVGPSDTPARGLEESAPARDARPVDAKKDESPGPYSSLSEDSFSAVASRRRGDLQRELSAAKRKLQAIESERADLRRKREQAQSQAVQNLQGVSAPAYHASPREEELDEQQATIDKEIEEIRGRYDELREEAEKRHGGLPPWWRPLQ